MLPDGLENISEAALSDYIFSMNLKGIGVITLLWNATYLRLYELLPLHIFIIIK
jgi:hypothetical protein